MDSFEIRKNWRAPRSQEKLVVGNFPAIQKNLLLPGIYGCCFLAKNGYNLAFLIKIPGPVKQLFVIDFPRDIVGKKGFGINRSVFLVNEGNFSFFIPLSDSLNRVYSRGAITNYEIICFLLSHRIKFPLLPLRLFLGLRL